MKVFTLDILQECLANRKRAKHCQRCKGTGLFRSIEKYEGLASSKGNECHHCSKLRKVPRSWVISSNYNRAAFFIKLYEEGCITFTDANNILVDLYRYEMLSLFDFDEVRNTIILSNEMNK